MAQHSLFVVGQVPDPGGAENVSAHVRAGRQRQPGSAGGAGTVPSQLCTLSCAAAVLCISLVFFGG